MGKMNRRTFSIIAAIIILLASVTWQLFRLISPTEPLTKTDAEKVVQEKYSGEIIKTIKTKDIYRVTIQLKTGVYDISIDGHTGDVAGISKIKSKKVDKVLTEDQVKQLILQQQNGEIRRLEKKEEDGAFVYYVVIEQNNDETTYKLNAVTGKVIDKTTKIRGNSSQETVRGITKDEAVKIAVNQVNGKVDDVDVEEKEGVSYYLVEIEREDGQDALVQINAITGEVITITWDD
ncbi:putative membrane protein YkoI [Oikeobacillus pervagus]|uniref:Membrane protein YkoI n=1 Tax=Oikeobacillus pervagus TaxID=1325931 RepID=A0AAJ1T184_9BACI|nr:PepSY domain-containing protein [Oikeobacillus pervagus]MDQ0216449.1 putative membrane protein YkoI [Oikeobacillus pervagus]